jgi:hypothetical protein
VPGKGQMRWRGTKKVGNVAGGNVLERICRRFSGRRKM